MSERLYRHIFGPVLSRRLGRSLGVDLTPLKTCTLNCLYCQLGRTTALTIERKSYVPVMEVFEELRHWRETGGTADCVTLSGSGEPTLHKDFGDVLSFIKRELGLPAVLLSNGTLFHLPDVRAAAQNADIVKVSLSAWDEASFQQIHRPHPTLSFEAHVEGIRAFREVFSGLLWVEVFLIAGIHTEDLVRRLAAIAERLRPDAVHLNTAVRPPAEPEVRPFSREEMEALSPLFKPPAIVVARFSSGQPSTGELSAERMLDVLRRHPATIQQLAAAFGVAPEAVEARANELVRAGRIRVEPREDGDYLRAV